MKIKVVITDLGYKHYNIERKLIESINGELEVRHCLTEQDVISLARDADGVIVRLQPFSARVIEKLEKCLVVARYGVGVDNIDIAAATKKGIVVANVLDYATDEVAEQALALLFSCIRKITNHDKKIRDGVWDIGQQDPIYRIQGKTLGLIGFGRIAQVLAGKVKGFEFHILAYDPFVKKELAEKTGVELTTLNRVLEESDYISLHLPLNKETFHLINEKTLRTMKSTAILVNTSRGGLVDTKALYRALKEGWINSAGIDVHEEEPPPKDYCLFELDNVVISDHAGWYSEESIQNLQRGAVEAVVAVLTGGWPKFLVNPEVKEMIKKGGRKW
ncbi:hydroxyacid dehydrogenase [Candidatus Desantisbacteria bacterium CG_4_10_14_0_8_um_filter_39_17]|nr:MAG: hydroxyacid dehydrogenase [Candidatus Desantisbacteria bacterium CG_4_10_14_0_8_um_filter_39_17]